MLRLIPNLRVKGRAISTEVQCMILSSNIQEISKGEIAVWVHDWLRCSLREATRIVESTLVACIKEEIKL
jgi:hypothetical protein